MEPVVVEFIGFRAAAQRLGVSRPTIRELVRRDQMPVYADPLDGRRKLLRLEDLDRLRHPRPLRQPHPLPPTEAA